MARYGQAFKDRAVARLLPPESAALDLVAREVGIGAGTLERWREDAQSRPARGRGWTAGARLEAVITTASMDEASKSAWCREHGVYPAELDKWRSSCTAALAEPEEARATPQATRHAMAVGQAAPDAKSFTLDAVRGSLINGIVSNPFLEQAFRTDRYTIKVGIYEDGTWSYEQDTLLIIPGQSEPFRHIDRNRLRKIAEPTPNPTALVARG